MYQFFVILGEYGNPLVVRRIQMQKRLQKELTELFGQQAAEFLNPNHQIVPFDSSYKPDEQEILEIAQYALPQEIADAAAHPHQVDPFTFEDNFKIKAIIATEHDATRGSTAAYFQVMNKTKILNRGNGLAILLSGNTFKKLDEPGLTLDTKLSAVYQNANLYLKSFAVVNRFLDLNDYFREATDEEIADGFGHGSLLSRSAGRAARSRGAFRGAVPRLEG